MKRKVQTAAAFGTYAVRGADGISAVQCNLQMGVELQLNSVGLICLIHRFEAAIAPIGSQLQAAGVCGFVAAAFGTRAAAYSPS